MYRISKRQMLTHHESLPRPQRGARAETQYVANPEAFLSSGQHAPLLVDAVYDSWRRLPDDEQCQ